MNFGIYIHIPYCLQLCPYCDFAKYEIGKIPDTDHYTHLLIKEIRQKHLLVPQKPLTSIYFGGGTPSLLSEKNFEDILKEIKNYFGAAPGLEITIEINPGNLHEEKLTKLMALGVNRFSVGSQTFNDDLLKKIGRKHSSEETRQTLNLLNKYDLNFSLDLLFALPNQTLSSLKVDIEESLSFKPKHVSTYYLNLPEKHELSYGRPKDDTQIEMFDLIESQLESNSLHRYEISNFAVKGFESRHNKIYWDGSSYWGIGLSSHSFLKSPLKSWGVRFWNPRTYASYQGYVDSLVSPSFPYDGLADQNIEHLEKYQSMTEFCYTSLRKKTGLNIIDFEKKYSNVPPMLKKELSSLISRGLLLHNDNESSYSLTQKGRILSNLVFERLTFLEEDLY